jgi:hypothetical protein
MSELIERADELRAIAAKCKTINDFRAATGWTMETCRHARDVLGLNLPDSAPRGGAVKLAQSCPKPAKKGAGK